MTKTKKTVYYVLLVLMTALFLFTSYDKLSSDPMGIAGFAQAHLPLWFFYFIGVAELAGAIGLWIPKLQKWAIYGLEIILVGAVVTTAIFISIPEAIMPLVVGLVLWYVMRLGKQKMSMPMATPSAPAPQI